MTKSGSSSGDKGGDAPAAAAVAGPRVVPPLAAVGHELRTPLTAIIGFAEMMLAGQLGPLGHPRYIEYARDIHTAANHALSLASDLLEVARLEGAGLPLAREAVDANVEAAACLAMMGALAGRAGIELVAAYSPAPLLVAADRRSLRQILLNLLSNAVKFTGAGGSVSMATQLQPDGTVLFEVRDTGQGISPRVLAQAELPLEPAGSSDPGSARSGSGIGLPLCRALALANGGRLDIESRAGRGTSVRLFLPAAGPGALSSGR